jgi:parvulin-like peptidyl-prolyl isomerase
MRIFSGRQESPTFVPAESKRHALVRASLLYLLLALTIAMCGASIVANAASEPSASVAQIGDINISREEYDQELHMAARRKFYHGTIPEGQMAVLQREVAANMVDNVLLMKEAKRIGLRPDVEKIKLTMSEYEKRYQGNEQWQSRRVVLLPKLQKQLEKESLIQQLKDKVHDVPSPSAAQLRSFYTANPDKFTEPEQVRTSVILLKVDPSSPRPVWEAARAEAASLLKKLRGGADFAQLARQRSGDESAANGGDMGYLHRGMLAEPAQAVVDKMKLKEISEPVTLLQGVAIFRLDERKAAVSNPLGKVEPRARELWRREQGQREWQTLLATLRKATPTSIDESKFLPRPAAANVSGLLPKAK